MPKTSAERKRLQRMKDQRDPMRKERKFDTIFMFGCVDIAVIIDQNGEPWFRGVDIARALEMENPRDAVSTTIENTYIKSFEELMSDSVGRRDIPSVHPKTTFVSEAGVNIFVIRSRKPKAEAFADWVCSVVLPSIRKTGKYEIGEKDNPYKELNDFLKLQVEEKDKQLESKETQLSVVMSKLFTMQPNCVPEPSNRLKHEYMVLFRKYDTSNVSEDGIAFPYYCCRVQENSFEAAKNKLKQSYPKLTILLKLKTPNSVNFFNHVLENLRGILRNGINSFQVKGEFYTEAQLIADVKNIYRITYGNEIV